MQDLPHVPALAQSVPQVLVSIERCFSVLRQIMNLVDLFCGCGGFSLGAHQAGFDVKAAFDLDPTLTSSYRSNFPDTDLQLRDVATLTGIEIEQIVGGKVDGLFGGPPCQGFSDIGHRDPNDPRRRLLLDFYRLVDELRPAFFVMENVRGLANKDSRALLDEGIARISDHYAILGPVLLDAADFGAATSRTRLFVMGFDTQRCSPLTMLDLQARRAVPVTVSAAISDLENATLIDDPKGGFDVWHVKKPGRLSPYARALRSPDGSFTGNRRTTHMPDTVARFATVVPGKHDPVGRHYRLKWEGQCPTLRAGTGSDRGSYQSVRPLHPDEPRVITVREAARLQGFPDMHLFHPTVWHSFRMIGNSVSPIMSRAIFSAIKSKLGRDTQ
jgi:DNA (cytosine-5)-methyltransferase 1